METTWFILGFILSFGAGCIFWFKRRKLHAKGIMTEAEVTDVFKSHGHYYTVIRFTTSNNRVITHTYDAGSFKSRFKTGDRVTLYYNPARPQKLVLVGRMEKWAPVFLIVFSFFILIIYFIFFRD